MTKRAILGMAAGVAVGGALAYALAERRRAMAAAEEAYARLLASPQAPPARFDPQQVAHLPEIARRYFLHAIAPGTPLYGVAELEMEGSFLLGDKDRFQSYAMTARQALRPPSEFVWIARMRSGAVTIAGSDALVAREAWTRFWLLGLVPVAQEPSSTDLVRSAEFRAAVEGAMWLPASLLPENGVEWAQTGESEAQVTFRRFDPEIVLRLRLGDDGTVREAAGQRWSNANSDRSFRFQPFGATVSAEASFQGFTIPTGVAAGNHFGTEEYLPFFQARIVGARYR